MKIGFTGTQKGMSAGQLAELEDTLLHCLISYDKYFEFHEGDCVGADDESTTLARRLGFKIIVHPPINSSKRAFNIDFDDLVLPRKEYLARNKDIVDATDLLIAAPFTDEEERRSGTWSTVRYAWLMSKEVIILKR